MDRTAGGVQSGAGATVDTQVMTDGWLLFAALMIMFTGIWNTFEGIFAFFRSSWFIGSAVFGSLWIWALLWTVFGVLLIAAGSAIMTGQRWGRWFGIVVVSLSAFIHLLAIGTYPWWSLIMIGIDVAIIYGLAAHWRGAPRLA